MTFAKSLRAGLLLLSGLTACVQAPAALESERPEKMAAGFYGQLRRQSVVGLPSVEAWQRLRPFCTDDLASAVASARDRQDAFRRDHPGEKPPWVDGDLFSSLFEGPQTFQLGEALRQGERAEVPVHCVHGEGAGATRWTDWLILRRSAAGWRVEDLRYGGRWDFALRGSLRQGLAAAD